MKPIPGQKSIYIDSEEQVEWFVQKFIVKGNIRSGYRKFEERKQEIQDSGDMPRNLEDYLKSVQIDRELGTQGGLENEFFD